LALYGGTDEEHDLVDRRDVRSQRVVDP